VKGRGNHGESIEEIEAEAAPISGGLVEEPKISGGGQVARDDMREPTEKIQPEIHKSTNRAQTSSASSPVSKRANGKNTTRDPQWKQTSTKKKKCICRGRKKEPE
jgi:hypothetical protein